MGQKCRKSLKNAADLCGRQLFVVNRVSAETMIAFVLFCQAAHPAESPDSFIHGFDGEVNLFRRRESAQTKPQTGPDMIVIQAQRT
jgi:hypothetical protein